MMKACKTQKILENIYSIKTGIVSMYLFKHGDKYIALDCGADMKKVEAGLLKLNIKKEDVSHVLLTHSDYDHVTALPFFTNAKVYMGHEEEQMINKITPRFSSFRYNDPLACEKYELLLDQQDLTFGDTKIKCIATPGHTPGSMSYLINNQFLFTGDSLSLKKGVIKPFFTWFVMDMETHLKSIEKIKNIRKASMIFTSHHGYVVL